MNKRLKDAIESVLNWMSDAEPGTDQHERATELRAAYEAKPKQKVLTKKLQTMAPARVRRHNRELFIGME